MTTTRDPVPVVNLQGLWLTRQEVIFRDCLDKVPDLARMAPKVSGLRLGIGLQSGYDTWDLVPLVGQDIDTIGIFDLPGDSGGLVAMTPDGAPLGIDGRDAVQTAQRQLMSLSIHILREVIARSADYLKTGIRQPVLRDLWNQQLLAIRCQAEMTEIAVNDPHADGLELLSALGDLVLSYLQWATQVDGLNPDWIALTKVVGRHAGTPWLLNINVAGARK